MALIDDLKKELGVTSVAFNTEITDLISAAEKELEWVGVDPTLIVDTDPLIKRFISIYVKANFGMFNSEAERYKSAMESLLRHFSLSTDYQVT